MSFCCCFLVPRLTTVFSVWPGEDWWAVLRFLCCALSHFLNLPFPGFLVRGERGANEARAGATREALRSSTSPLSSLIWGECAPSRIGKPAVSSLLSSSCSLSCCRPLFNPVHLPFYLFSTYLQSFCVVVELSRSRLPFPLLFLSFFFFLPILLLFLSARLVDDVQ